MADSRAAAEDAAAKVSIAWQVLAPVADMETALDKTTPVIHPELGDNLVFERVNESGNVAEAFRAAHKVVEATFHSGRHTGVTLEPRSILAEFNKGDGTLTVHHATQAPHMMQEVLARHLKLPLSAVRVICRDIGGSYGIKVHVYPDEVAVRGDRQDHGPTGASSSPIAWRASPPISTRATTASRAAWPSTRRAASPPSTSTT